MINWLKKLFGVDSEQLIEEVKQPKYPYSDMIINCIDEGRKNGKLPFYQLYLNSSDYFLAVQEIMSRRLGSRHTSRSFLCAGVEVFNKDVIEEEKRREYFANPFNFC